MYNRTSFLFTVPVSGELFSKLILFREDSQMDFFKQSVLWTLGGGGGGVGGFAVGRFKKNQ